MANKKLKKIINKKPNGGTFDDPIAVNRPNLAYGPSFFGNLAMDIQSASRPVQPKNIDQVWNSYGPYINTLTRKPGTEGTQIKGYHVGIKDKSGKFYYLPKKDYDRLYSSDMGFPTNAYSLGGPIQLAQMAQQQVGGLATSIGKAFNKNNDPMVSYFNENILGNIGNPIGMISGLIGAGKFKRESEQQERQGRMDQMANTQQQASLNQPSYSPTFPMGGMIPYTDAELEKEEVVETPDGQLSTMDAPPHSQGGIDITAPVGSRVFSDRLKPKGSSETYAQLADKIKKQIEKYEKILNS
jgi:hypothetical protein